MAITEPRPAAVARSYPGLHEHLASLERGRIPERERRAFITGTSAVLGGE